MPLPDFVTEPVDVELRILSDGRILPSSFTWRERRVAVSDVGRTWQEHSVAGIRTNYLVGSSNGDVYELQHDPALGKWTLLRAWSRGADS
jgi:hypothetical protein